MSPYKKQKDIIRDFLRGTPRDVLNLDKNTVSIRETNYKSGGKKYTMIYDSLGITCYPSKYDFSRLRLNERIEEFTKFPENPDVLRERRALYLEFYAREYLRSIRGLFLEHAMQNAHIKFFSRIGLVYESLMIPNSLLFRMVDREKAGVMKQTEDYLWCKYIAGNSEDNLVCNISQIPVAIGSTKNGIRKREEKRILRIYIPIYPLWMIVEPIALSFEYEDENRNFMFLDTPDEHSGRDSQKIHFREKLGNIDFQTMVLLVGDTVKIPGINRKIRIEKMSEQFLNSLGYLRDSGSNVDEFFIGSRVRCEVDTDSCGDVKSVVFSNLEELSQ